MTTTNSSIPPLYLSRREALQLIGLGLVVPGAFAGCGSNDKPPSWSTGYEATIADTRAEIARLLAAENGPNSISVALVDDQRIIWSEASGFLDKSRNLAPTPDTLFGLASGSKVFAALATMVLVDRGLVNLDVPYVHYVPTFRMLAGEVYHAITVRMLLSHSSGLPGSDYRNGSTFVPFFGHAFQVMAGIATQRLKHRPGEMAVYCNDGFSLIELLVSTVTGTSYSEFVTQEILMPLGMTRSRLGTDTLEPGTYAAALDSAGKPYPQEYINVLGTGGVYSTVREMGRLALMLLNGGKGASRRLLSLWAVTEMGSDQSAALPLNPFQANHYGLGWDSVQEAGFNAVGVRVWSKNGGSNYFSTQFDIAPDDRLAVVAFGAGGAFDAHKLAERFLLHALQERGRIAALPSPLVPRTSATIPADTAEVQKITGYYASRELSRLAPQAQGLTYSQSFWGQWYLLAEGLRQRANGEWTSNAVPEIAYFTFEAEGRLHLARRHPEGLGHYEVVDIKGQKLAPVTLPLSTAWQSRVGRSWLVVNEPYSTYYILKGVPPLITIRQVEELAGYIIASQGNDYVLDPHTSDTRALMCGKIGARDINDLIIDERDMEEWLILGSYRYRPLETVPLLTTGQSTIAIGSEGLGEWRSLPILSRLAVTGATSWYLYGNDYTLLNAVVKDRTFTKDWSGSIPEGAFLMVYGEPGAIIHVTTG